MAKIYVGTKALRTKSAISQLKKNILFLERKINRISSLPHLVKPLIVLYSEKLEAQRFLLTWLQHETR